MSKALRPLKAAQDALAAEHAAVFVLAHLLGRTSASAAPDLAGRLRAGYVLHRARRDQLLRLVRDQDAAPVAAETLYDLPPSDTAAEVRSAADTLEERCSAVYATMVGATWGGARQWALRALTESAVGRIAYGAAPQTWPGLPELEG
ncbi:MAG: DUF4439 domain-containing protein [Nocardioides sp.]|nr:DUF4439 domain-containing protein [Nocardioides sp.]